MNSDFCNQINSVIASYLDHYATLVNKINMPIDGSKATQELNDPIYSTHVASAYSWSLVLQEIALDNLEGIKRTLTEPLLTYAPFVLFRGLLEVSAISVWLGSTTVNSMKRAERFFIFRNNSLTQQKKFYNSINDSNNIKIIEEKIDQMIVNAQSKGLFDILHKKGERLVIVDLPSSTELIKNIFDAEDTYRLFSAIAHGKHWAVILSSFNTVEKNIEIYKGIKGGRLEKDISPLFMLYVVRYSLLYLGKSLIERYKLFGYNPDSVIQLFEKSSQDIKSIAIAYEIPINWKD